MNVGIYCILNLINGKLYIGQSTNLNKREYDHFRHLNNGNHPNPHLQFAFNKYGRDNFDFILITYCSEEELDELEQHYIAKYKTMDRNNGYNRDSGGSFSRKLSDESIKKMSKTLSVNKNSVGFYRVYKQGKKDSIQGFQWCYRYYDLEGKKNQIRSINLMEVKEKVLSEGLDWFVVDQELANKSIKENEYNLIRNKKGTNTGFYRTSYDKSRPAFIYQFNDDEKHVSCSRKDLDDLKEEVLARGWDWFVVDEKKANQIIELNIKNRKKIEIRNKNMEIGKTGFYNVSKLKCAACKQGFTWGYKFEHNYVFHSVDLDDLKEKVLSEGLLWKITDEKKAKKSIEINNKFSSIRNERKPPKQRLPLLKNSRNTTGFLRVSSKPCKRCNNGKTWVYSFKKESISSVDLYELKEKVLNKGWLWKMIDEEKARKSVESNKSKQIKTTNTGFYKVSKLKGKKYKQGFTWSYYGEKQLRSTNLLSLKEKVISNKLNWEIIDEELAKESVELHNSLNSLSDDFEKFKSEIIVKLDNDDNENHDVIESIKKEGTGFFRVYLYENKSYKRGIQWRYFNEEKELSSVDLNVLKEKVISNGFEWRVIDENKAKRSLELNNPKKIATTNSGFYKVSKVKCNKCKQGFTWAYYGKRTIRATDLCNLRDKVLKEGYEWKIIDEVKAKKSIECNLNNSG